ncbi:hypothetical protein GCM10011571_23040 [Marinithermofilum abyssi]|uniref:Helix-turn-helix domain-containing protein n=1 Tax=Marinithermofilum abyssi TaxID=1571185 RepID=A0A8J2VH66_9BACL|nr:hypothetical protein [Marinithermofilum abyssi]GGE20461.1 hypothetical protein GCM10011571_23040 [Marinithermofilum abyssi]
MTPFHDEEHPQEETTGTETLFTLEEAADKWHIRPETLQQAVDDGQLFIIEKGEKHYVTGQAMEASLDYLQELDLMKEEAAANDLIIYLKKKKTKERMEEDPPNGNAGFQAFFENFTHQLQSWNRSIPHGFVKRWLERFFKTIELKKKKEVETEWEERQVSLKLGFMTGQNEMACDFCEVHDHFYPGAIFADVYVDGQLKWIMCPNCLLYCKEQANGSMEQNVRARFHYLAHRLEKEARRARSLAVTEDFQVPSRHEWEAWETASFALREVAASNRDPAEEPFE